MLPPTNIILIFLKNKWTAQKHKVLHDRAKQTARTHSVFCATVYGRWWCSWGTIHPSIVLHNHTHIHTHKISTSTCQSCKRGSAELYLGTNRAAQNQKPANVARHDTGAPPPKCNWGISRRKMGVPEGDMVAILTGVKVVVLSSHVRAYCTDDPTELQQRAPCTARSGAAKLQGVGVSDKL